MAVPSPRVPVKLARGFYAVFIGDQSDIEEGELIYAKDQNTLYVKEGGSLVPIVGKGSAASNSLRAGDNITKLVNDAGYITLSNLPDDRVQSVNGHVGVVVVDADDIPVTGTVNKFTTTDEINKLAGIEVGAQVNEVAEAPQDGNYYVRQSGAWVDLATALSALEGRIVGGGNFTTGVSDDNTSDTVDGGVFS